MRVEKIEQGHKERYQSFVKANGYFLQDWDWGDFQESLGRKVFRYLVQQRGEVILSAQCVCNRIRNSKTYLFLPYGPVFKNNSNVDERSDAFRALIKELQKEFDLMFVRFEPMQGLAHMDELKKTIDNNPHQTLLLDLNKASEQLLSEMHHKTRYNIKVAQKHGVEIKTSDHLDEKNNPFAESAQRAGIKSYDLD